MTSDAGLTDAVLSDAELIAAVRAGDTDAFARLYERHGEAALAVARQYARSEADAEDITSDAFAKVFAVIAGGGGPDAAFRAYLFTVVRRLAFATAQGIARVQVTDDVATFESAFGPAGSVEEPALEGFERSVVARAFNGLPERWQSVLWYTEVEEMSAAQIAPLLGLSANGVAALTYRAREGLRQGYLQHHLTTAPTKQCADVLDKLGAHVRGGLSARDSGPVEAHLEGCTECQALVVELGDVNHGMRVVVAPLVLGIAGTAALVPGGLGIGTGAAGATASSGAAAGSGVAGGAAGSGVAAGGGLAGLIASAPIGALVATAALVVGVVAVSVAAALGVFSPAPTTTTAAAPPVTTSIEDESPPPISDATPAPGPDDDAPEVDEPDSADPPPSAGDPGDRSRGDGDDSNDDAPDGDDRDDDGRDDDGRGDDDERDDDGRDDDPGDDGTDDDGRDDDPSDDTPDDADEDPDNPDDPAPSLGTGPEAGAVVLSRESGGRAALTVANSGGAATGLSARVTLPEGVRFVAPVAPGVLAAAVAPAAGSRLDWPCTPVVGGSVTECSSMDLPAGATGVITLDLAVDPDSPLAEAPEILVAITGAGLAPVTLAFPVQIDDAAVDDAPSFELIAHPEALGVPTSGDAAMATFTLLNHSAAELAGAELWLTLPHGVFFGADPIMDGTWTCGSPQSSSQEVNVQWRCETTVPGPRDGEPGVVELSIPLQAESQFEPGTLAAVARVPGFNDEAAASIALYPEPDPGLAASAWVDVIMGQADESGLDASIAITVTPRRDLANPLILVDLPPGMTLTGTMLASCGLGVLGVPADVVCTYPSLASEQPVTVQLMVRAVLGPDEVVPNFKPLGLRLDLAGILSDIPLDGMAVD